MGESGIAGKFRLDGKAAFVTGASGGLGAHFARLLAQSGARVALAARRVADCQNVVEAILATGGEALALPMDVTKAQSIQAAMAGAETAFGPLDLLINNAGIATTAPWLETDEAEFDRVMDTNLKGAFLASNAFAARLKAAARPGAIVNIASILGLAVTSQVGSYAVSKAALVQMTKSMALEWARFGIRVNALCPGYVATDINRAFFESEAGKAVIRRIPQRRLGRMQDLDAPLLLLAAEGGAFITGATLAVDGGHLLTGM